MLANTLADIFVPSATAERQIEKLWLFTSTHGLVLYARVVVYTNNAYYIMSEVFILW